jgi:hypothetical protein
MWVIANDIVDVTHHVKYIHGGMARVHSPTAERERPNQFSFELLPELREGLQFLKERDGVPVAESIRRAIRAWLEEKDALAGGKQTGRKAKTKGRRA